PARFSSKRAMEREVRHGSGVIRPGETSPLSRPKYSPASAVLLRPAAEAVDRDSPALVVDEGAGERADRVMKLAPEQEQLDAHVTRVIGREDEVDPTSPRVVNPPGSLEVRAVQLEEDL